MPELLLIGNATQTMLERMATQFTIHRWSDLSLDWLAQNGARITHVATNGHDGIEPTVMAALPNLKLIACYGVGYDAIDTAEAVRRGILVTHTPDVLNEEVATTAVMLMLACYRNLLGNDAYARSGDWAAKGSAPLTRSAEEQVVGILGMGRIGQSIAAKLAPWSPRILYHSRSQKDVPYEYFSNLTEMATASDVLICITPGGAGTRHLVNTEVLQALGPRGCLVNVSRGSVVDEAALIAALQSGALGSAGLDVFEREPHVPQALCDLPNTVLLPHVGSATVETRAAMGALTVDNLLAHLKDGSVLTPVPECAGLLG
ncbi:2-hydroxyacid dehydrogenase [Alphaproteobacteria bacterium KMM 3653]|uniref:2-hydroxyacid dehydrogenase n=1 Tax=Harenicola maris TaxID=2841044 RepID=A0AAP2G317_9RHOB|nr:2-hydroxyacid dehydrogenase [Harenicola maris]